MIRYFPAEYNVYVEREYVFVNSGYYVFRVSMTNKQKFIGKKIVTNKCKPRPPFTDETNQRVYWDGNCIFCKGETVTFATQSAGCVTGHSSMYLDTLCPKCLMIHYAEEHDD